MNFSISGGNSNYNQEGTSYQNGVFIGVNETYNNVGKLTLDGFEQYGGKVTGNIAEFEIKSKQNTSEINGSSTNYSAGTNMQTIGTASGPTEIANNAMKGMNGSIGGNTTSGSRTYVDTPSAFVIGEGSDLSIGKATNTGAIIGTEDNGKIKIKEYEGKDLKNSDTYNVTGGTVGTGGAGVEYQDKDKAGITHNTVIGNVEIGKSTGDEINRDINNVQETTKDKDSGYYNTFVESGVLALTTKEGREKFKQSIDLAGDEVEAMKIVIDTTIKLAIHDDSKDQKKGFIDVLQTERLEEGIRNVGYVDLSGKSDKEIEDTMKEKYGDLFARFGKDIEVDFYTDSEVSESDPLATNKKGAAGFVGEDGKMWLNKDHISSEQNFSINNLFGHESVHVVKGPNSELLAQFGEQRASVFIQDAIDNGKLSYNVTQPVKDWNKGTLTEKERGDLAKAQDIEEKLKFLDYNTTASKDTLEDKIKDKFYGVTVNTDYINYGIDNKKSIAGETATELGNNFKNDLVTATSTNATEADKTTFKNKYDLTDEQYNNIASGSGTPDQKLEKFKIIELERTDSTTMKDVDKILSGNLPNNKKISEIQKMTGVTLSTADLNDLSTAKDKIKTNISFTQVVANETNQLANDARWESDVFRGFYGDNQKLTNMQLVVDSDDFVWYVKGNGSNISLSNSGVSGNIQYVRTDHMSASETQHTSLDKTKVEDFNTYDLSGISNSAWNSKVYGTGTGLVKNIIDKNDKTTYVIYSTTDYNVKCSTVNGGNCSSGQTSNLWNGNGTDMKISYNPLAPNINLPNKIGVDLDGLNKVNGTNTLIGYEGYGHELIHADDGMNGIWKVDQKFSQNYDSNGDLVFRGIKGETNYGVQRDSNGNVITNPNIYIQNTRSQIATMTVVVDGNPVYNVPGSIVENEVLTNLKVKVIFERDSLGNITNVKTNYIIPLPEKEMEYKTVGVPYIKGIDSSGNFIYETNVTNKPFTENKIRIEHGLPERGQY